MSTNTRPAPPCSPIASQRPVGREAQVADDRAEAGETPQERTAVRIEQVHRALLVPFPAGPAAGSDDLAVGRDLHVGELALALHFHRHAQHVGQAQLGQRPDAHGAIERGRDQAIVCRIVGERTHDAAVPAGFNAEDRIGGGHARGGAPREGDEQPQREPRAAPARALSLASVLPLDCKHR